jgi:cytochrome c-type biogenesis protein CcmH
MQPFLQPFWRKDSMAAYKFGAVGMAGGIIALAAAAAWLGLAHSCDPKAGEGVIGGQVVIAPALADQVRATDVLFVIVRRPGGTPRPVAAKRIENPVFPVRFEITNADVMVQGSELRGMVDVMARLDRDGEAGPAQPGDIEGRYAKNPTLPGGRDLEIILDTIKN